MSGTRRVVRRLALSAVVGWLMVPTVAQADPQWIPDPLTVFPRTTAEGSGTTSNAALGVGMSGRGETVALFRVYSGSTGRLNASVRAPGGAFGAPQQLADEDFGSAALAVAPDGTALAVWSTGAGPSHLRYAVRAPGGSFGAAADLPGGDHFYGGPEVAFDGGGNATIAWASTDGVNTEIHALRRSAGGTFGTPQTVSDATASNTLDLAVNPRGDALIAWADGLHVDATLKPAAAASFPAATTIGPTANNVYGVDAALSPAGDAAVTWWQFIDDGGLKNRLRGALRPAGTSGFGAWATVSGVDEAPFSTGNEFEGAFDGSGRFVVVWWRTVGANRVLEFATAAPGATTFGPPGSIPETASNAFEPHLIADAQGRLLFVYRTDTGGGPYRAKGTFVPPGGAFGTAVPIGPPGTGDDADGHDLSVAVDANGNGVLLYGSTLNHGGPTDPPNLVRVAGFDGAGPLLDGLQIPAGGVAGDPLSFGVSPVDVWSPLAGTRWSFGDGTTSDVATTTHAYAAAGPFPVSVTAADSRGNVTTSPAATTNVTARPVVTPEDLTAPRLTNVSLLRSTFRVGAAATALSARVRHKAGTAFRFRLSEAATVRIAIARELPGRRVRGHCRASGPKRARRCTRVVAKGTLRRVLPAGRARVAFSGRIGRKALVPGRYRATLSATDAAGNRRTIKPLRFRVVAR